MREVILPIIVVVGLGCSAGKITNDIVNVPTDTLVGFNILKGDSNDPNYRTYYGPGEFHIDYENHLWVSDEGGMRILKYDPNGEYQYQILLYPESTIVSKKSPEFQIDQMYCGGLPISIQDFSFDRDGNLYIFDAYAGSEGTQFEIRILRRDGSIYIAKLDITGPPFKIALDSQKRIYFSRTPRIDGDHWIYKGHSDSLIVILDSLGNKIKAIGSPITTAGWNRSERSSFNQVLPSLDKKDNLWLAFAYNQPMVRKYDPEGNLIFERKYLTAEIKRVMAITDSVRHDMIARTKNEGEKDDRRRAYCHHLFYDIVPLSSGGGYLFVFKGVVYELNDKGLINRKIILEKPEKELTQGVMNFITYSLDSSGSIYEFFLIMPTEDSPLNQIKIYKFTGQKERR